MSTDISPPNKSRAKKVAGGRVVASFIYPKKKWNKSTKLLMKLIPVVQKSLLRFISKAKTNNKRVNTMALKQKRDNRFNVNLTDDESQLFVAVSKLTGLPPGVILRQLVMKQALATLIAEDIDNFNLDEYLTKGAQGHLSRS